MRTVAFHILNSFRGLIHFACAIGAMFSFIFMIVTFFADLGIARPIGGFIFFVGFGAARWYLDALILKLAPVGPGQTVVF